MDIVTYALCKKIAAGAVTGIKDLQVQDLDLIITMNDDSQITMSFPKPEDGVSVTSLEIDAHGHLIGTLSDGSTVDAGMIDPRIGAEYAKKSDIDNLFVEGSDIDDLFKGGNE